MKFIEYPDSELMAIDVAGEIAEDLTSTLDHQDKALLVVAGGTTPAPVYDILSDCDLDWARVRVLLSDERWVPSGDPRSNTDLIGRHLLTGRASAAELVPLYLPGYTPAQAGIVLPAQVEELLPVSVCLLGMGPDMHVASLFPGAPGLEAALAPNAPAVLPMVQPETGEARMSLSARVLNGAMAKHLLIMGREKRDALQAARGLGPAQAPVRVVLDGVRVHWAES